MRIAHLADLHLGQRRFHRVTPSGQNQREADIAATWLRTVDAVIEAHPDVVLVAGDVFHAPRPPNAATLAAMVGFDRIRRALPDAHLLMISGNHDLPRVTESTCLLSIFRQLGWFVVERNATRLKFGDLSILCVPECEAHKVELKPDATATRNVLLLHGEIAGAIPGAPLTEHSIEPERLGESWDYVALGHYHVHSEVAPRTYYAGAMEYTSSDIWREARSGVPKGFIVYDLESGSMEFVCPAVARPVVDLRVIEAGEMGAEELTAALQKNADTWIVDGAIARQVIRNCTRERQMEIAPALKSIRARCMEYQVETPRPSVRSLGSLMIETPEGGKRRKTLREMVAEFFEKREFPADVDVAEITALAQKYLEEAEAREQDKAAKEAA